MNDNVQSSKIYSSENLFVIIAPSSRDTLIENYSFSIDNVNGFGKASLDAHNKQIHFSLPIDSFVHQLKTDDSFTDHSTSVCFPRGLFLWPTCCP